MAISLASLKTGQPGKINLKMVLAGTPGVGKTTFACMAPNPVVIQTEEGIDPLIHCGVLPDTIQRFPKAQSFEDVMGAITALYTEQHDFKTLVVDSIDWLEPLVWQAVCAKHTWPSIESPGYGKGYIEADKSWKDFLDGLNALRTDRDMHIILISHTQIRKFESPDEAQYDRYELKVNKRAAALLEEWADVVGTARFKNLVQTRIEGSGKNEKKITKALATQDRVIYLSDKPSTTAKNRFNLPAEISLNWADFATALKI